MASIENLQVDINGETVVVSGKAKDQTTKEKVVLVVGNVEGIAQVDDRLDVEHKGRAAERDSEERDRDRVCPCTARARGRERWRQRSRLHAHRRLGCDVFSYRC